MPMQPMLRHDAVLAGVTTIKDELVRQKRAAVIAVVDAHGEALALLRLDGAPLQSVSLALNKAFTAARLDRPSRVLGERIRERGTDIAYYGDLRYCGFGGGLPLHVDGKVAGGVGVSGLSDEEDEALAALAIEAIVRAGAT